MSESLERSFSTPDFNGDNEGQDIFLPPPRIEKVGKDSLGKQPDKNIEAVYGGDEKGELEEESRAEKTAGYFKYLEKQISPIDEKYRIGRLGSKEYLLEIRALKNRLLQEEESLEKSQDIIMYFESASVIESQVIRNSCEPQSETNLALREAQWQLELADFYLDHPGLNNKLAVEILKVCINRFSKTSKMLKYDDEYVDSIVRGFSGLIANIEIFRKLGYQIELPTAKQDAVKKIDLMAIDPKNKIKYLCQLKTKAKYMTPLVEKVESRRPLIGDKQERDYIKTVNTLLESAQEMRQKEKELTIIPVCITLSETEISDSFVPSTSMLRSIQDQIR